ncbi:16S rRNA (uracil(1498)-N(3))-methyltransferase [bacterium]|nr:16S rRNA (uracil(1498)-N(3))-methyltransferase [candidate division CSSED10-310 bacterium]
MSSDRFYLPVLGETGDMLAIEGSEHKHLAVVLRMKPGAVVRVTDGAGREVEALVLTIDRNRTLVKIISERLEPVESSLDLRLAFTPLRSRVDEEMVRVAVELGVTFFQPVTAERMLGPAPLAGTARLERYRKVAVAALKQSGRRLLPGWLPAVTPLEAVRNCRRDGVVLLIDPGGGPFPRHDPGSQSIAVTVCIGPEGGFTDGEVKDMTAAGAGMVHLGPRILRAPHAAAAALVLAQYHWGDLNPSTSGR